MMAAQEKLKSVHSHTPVMVVFQNRTQRFVDLFWVDFNGKLVRYKNGLQENHEYAINTYETHPWIARDSQTLCPLLIKNDFVYNPKENHDIEVQRINITIPVYSLVDRCVGVLRKGGVHNVADSLDIPTSLKHYLKESRSLIYREYQRLH